jgi:hypothetical protein
VRRGGLLLLMLLVVAACSQAAAAHHKPNHHKPGHGTTTTMPITTTTPTTVPVCSPGTPITVSSGTVLRGCYRSTDPAVPAITVTTTQLVELDHARVEHAGDGVRVVLNGAQLNIHDSTFQKLPTTPGVDEEQRAVFAWGVIRLIVENNKMIDGDGVHWNDGDGTAVEGRFRYNEVYNVGRYRDDATPHVQAFVANNARLGGMEVAWNKVVNTFGQTGGGGDIINFHQDSPATPSGGVSGNHAQVHHNLIDGAYPIATGFADWFGGGIIVGDNGSSFIDVHHNWVIATTNYGIAIAGGTNHEIYDNVVVNTAVVNGVITGPDFGAGMYDNFNTENVGNLIHDNTIGWVRPTSASTTERFDKYFPSAASPFDVYNAADDAVYTNNTSMADPIDESDYAAARAAWEAARAAAGVVIGPRP